MQILNNSKLFGFEPLSPPHPSVHAHRLLLLENTCQESKDRRPWSSTLTKSALILDAPVCVEAEKGPDLQQCCQAPSLAVMPCRSGCWELLKMKTSRLGRCLQVSAAVMRQKALLEILSLREKLDLLALEYEPEIAFLHITKREILDVLSIPPC